MIGRIDHFKRVGIGQGLSDFQTDRHAPRSPIHDALARKGMATTKIRPHSLYEMKQSGKTRRRAVRRFSKSTGVSPAVARAISQVFVAADPALRNVPSA